MRRFLKIGLPGLLVVLVAIQLIPVERSNPPVSAPIDGPPEVVAVLERCCYDCHSNATQWPWYSYVAPVSWLVAHDVEEGREHLNFSTWGAMQPRRRVHAAEECVEHVVEGVMPLPIYLRMHPDAQPSESDVRTLRSWARMLGGETDDTGGVGGVGAAPDTHDHSDDHDDGHGGHQE